MSLYVIIFLVVLGVVSLATLIYVGFKFGLKKQPENLQEELEIALAAEEEIEEINELQAKPEEIIKEEIVVINEQSEVAVTDIEDETDDREIIKRIPFAQKLLSLDVKTQEYYDMLVNEFVSFRKMNRRISTPCLSLRLGRELVAKITARGKTMKLHLKLDVNKFEPKIFFQKDLSDVKAYSEVPFTVKVKSDRAVKNAIKLIDALAAEHGIERKVRFERIDALADLKASLE